MGPFVANSNWQSVTSKPTYDVVLASKNTWSKTHTGLGGLHNFLLATMIEKIGDARKLAIEIASELELPLESEEQLVEFLNYDPLSDDPNKNLLAG